MRLQLHLQGSCKALIKKGIRGFSHNDLKTNVSVVDSFEAEKELEILRTSVKYLQDAKRFHSDRLRKLPLEQRSAWGIDDPIVKIRKQLWAVQKQLKELQRKHP